MSPDQSTRITLVRHGETEFNRTDRYMGRLPGGLNRTGHRQAARLAARLEAEGGADRLFCSPLRRTRETASHVERRLGLVAQDEPDVQEIDMGVWEGRVRAEVARENPDIWQTWLTDPNRVRIEGMESIDALEERVGRAIDGIVARHPGEHCLVVTHFACVVAAVLHTLDLPASAYRRFSVRNTSLTRLRFGGPVPQLRAFNDDAHVGPLGDAAEPSE